MRLANELISRANEAIQQIKKIFLMQLKLESKDILARIEEFKQLKLKPEAERTTIRKRMLDANSFRILSHDTQ